MRHGRTILLALLAVGLAGGLWVLLSPGEVRGRSASAAPREEVTAPQAPSAPADLVAPATAVETASERAEVAAEAEEPAVAAAAGETLLVELVIAETGAPAALADVWYRHADAGDELLVAEIDDGSTLTGPAGQVLAQWGGIRVPEKKLRVDEQGFVRLPLAAEKSLQVLAQQGEYLGVETFPFDPYRGKSERLELVRDMDLSVLVLEASGEPAPKVPLHMERRTGSSSSSSSKDTGPDGIARFEHLGLRAREHPGASWFVRLSLPIAGKLEQPFDPTDLPGEPLLFRLPPLGEVEVLVLDAGGQPAADGTDVMLGVVGPEEPRDLSPFASRNRQYAHETTSAGRALFARVETGLEVEVRAGRDQWHSHTRGFFPGPARGGERVQHVLRIGLDHPVLSFRALEESLEPLRETELELRTWSRSGWNTSWNEHDVRTDGEGVFQVDLAGGWKAGDEQKLVVLAREGAIGAAFDLSRAFEPGPNPMGDLVLRSPPLLAEGRVVDSAGQGVAGVEVELQTAPDSEQEFWSDVDLDVKSGAAGEFAARGFVTGARLRLTPRQEGRTGEAVECEAGARGVELVLLATGSVVGAVLLGEGVPADQVHLRLASETGGEDEDEPWTWWDSQVEPGSSGEFRIEDQLPGRYTLRISLEDDLEVLEIPGVEVVAGETTRDPRLAAIDLRGRLVVMRFRFLPPEPDTNLEGNLRWRESGASGGHEHWEYFRGNPAVLVTPFASLDVTCSVRGYRTVALEGVSGEREVPLERALRVRLVLPAGVEVPAPPYYLKATLVGEDEHGNVDFGASAFDESRESQSLVGGTGRMRVQWLLERRSDGSASATTLDLEPEQWVVVVESSEEQRFELEVSREALEKVLAEPPF